MAHRPHIHLAVTAHREAGFTLVELMIVLFISGLVMAALVTIYTAQTRAYSKHDDIADIQQNLRGALFSLAAFGVYATHDAVVKHLGAGYAPFQTIFFSLTARTNASNAAW